MYLVHLLRISGMPCLYYLAIESWKWYQHGAVEQKLQKLGAR